jgi:hypothetical protein
MGPCTDGCRGVTRKRRRRTGEENAPCSFGRFIGGATEPESAERCEDAGTVEGKNTWRASGVGSA